ncbi:hypothetical protein C8R41DRAFT_471247 [Lentinula lateritia]|uniref:Secreted protein n=1 Tax=Lentinula lateritia TaxID=40482 RepID=A0ABQ8VCL7_9AGAR|nr:hypothetical protein C8R41DRAFT_471247 [Lentinula lateritia]
MVQLSVPYVLLITVPTLAVSIYKSNKIHLVLAHCVSVRLTAFSILQHLCAARSCYVDPFRYERFGHTTVKKKSCCDVQISAREWQRSSVQSRGSVLIFTLFRSGNRAHDAIDPKEGFT